MADEVQALLICPKWFELRDENLEPNPELCPPVVDNIFAPFKTYIVSKSLELFAFILKLYNPDLVDFRKSLNKALRLEAEDAANNSVSFILFAICMSSYPRPLCRLIDRRETKSCC